MANTHGHRVWFFPDGDIPPMGDPNAPMYGHESLVILNPNDDDAQVTLTIYYPDREADILPALTVEARRVRCVRTNEPIGDYQIPFGQYAMKLESTTPIICQIGRADVCQPNLAYFTTLGFASD